MTTSVSNKLVRVLFVAEWDRLGIFVDDRLADFTVDRQSQKDYLGLVPERQQARCRLLRVGA
ncbi:hypothetical protein D6T65_15610 [Arthrobacter frigidicola]|nr:hypothetical protein D6T65_15610 [Arthrobacter frigidicola]